MNIRLIVLVVLLVLSGGFFAHMAGYPIQAVPAYLGSSQAALAMGDQYLYGAIQDGKQAVYWYIKAAEGGSGKAMFNLGGMYSKGYGVPVNKEEGFSWMMRAAQSGNLERSDKANVQNGVGWAYQRGEGTPKNVPEAIKWYKQAYENGSDRAAGNLYYVYMENDGIAPDYAEAFKWTKILADKGQPEAQMATGSAYLLGRGVHKDEAEAARWFQLAAEQNYAPAYYNIAWGYMTGRNGSGVDVIKARQWALKAVDANVQGASLLIQGTARLYLEEKPPRPQEAYSLLKEAAARGDQQSVFQLRHAFWNPYRH